MSDRPNTDPATKADDSEQLGGKNPSHYEDSVSASSPQDVSGSRSLGTWYQNTSGVPLVVAVNLSSNFTTDSNMSLKLDINTSQSAKTVRSIIIPGGNSNAPTRQPSVFAVVPDGEYYRASSNIGALDTWFEYNIQL